MNDIAPDGRAHGRAASLAEEVLIGADAFLFHRFEMAFEQLCGEDVPTDRQLARWQTLFEQRLAWCAAQGIAYTTLVIPERHVIYADKLPPDWRIAPGRAVSRLAASLAPPLRAALLYPEAALREAKAAADVFLRTDEHISAFGSYICYRALLAHLAPALPLVPLGQADFTVSTRSLCGNLGMRLDSEPTETAEIWRANDAGAVERVFLSAPGRSRVEVFRNADATLPKAIAFGDSNLFSLWHFLAPHFSRLVLVHDTHRMFHDLVRAERPDLVLNVMSETRLGNLAPNGTAVVPIDTDIADFHDHCGEPLPCPTSRPLLAIDFTSHGNGIDWTREGWGQPETGHRWMTGGRSIVKLPAIPPAAARNLILEVDLSPNLRAPARMVQRLEAFCGNGLHWRSLGEQSVTANTVLQFAIPDAVAGEAAMLSFLRFDHPDGAAPADEGAGRDIRLLSFAARSLAVRAR